MNFWQPTLSLGEQRHLTVAMVNDEDRPRAGKLRVSFTDAGGKEAAAEELSFSLPPLGAESYDFAITAPQTPGSYSLQAVASPEDDSGHPTDFASRCCLALILVAASPHLHTLRDGGWGWLRGYSDTILREEEHEHGAAPAVASAARLATRTVPLCLAMISLLTHRPRPVPGRFLGGEKRFENPLSRCLAHPAAVVRDEQSNTGRAVHP